VHHAAPEAAALDDRPSAMRLAFPLALLHLRNMGHCSALREGGGGQVATTGGLATETAEIPRKSSGQLFKNSQTFA